MGVIRNILAALTEPQRRSWLRIANAHYCYAIFLLALTLRTLIVVLDPGANGYREQYHRVETVNIARSLYRTGSFADPYAEPTGPTAHSPPLYPFLLSLVYRAAGGISPAAELLKRLLSSAVASLQYALLPIVASECGMPVSAGVIAGLFGSLLPLSVYTEVSGHNENTYLGLMLVLGAILTLRSWRRNEYTTRITVAHGLFWGTGFLLSPVLLPCLLGTMAVGWYSIPKSDRRVFWRHCALVLALSTAVTIPWIFRNYVQLGGFVPVRSNFKLEFFLSNNPLAHVSYEENRRREFPLLHPDASMEEARKVREIGELAYNQKRFDEAVSWIRVHPGRFLQMTVMRVADFWFPVSRTTVKTAMFIGMTLCGFLGLVLLARTVRIPALLLGSLLATFSSPYYLIQVSHRYRYPIDWIVLLLSAFAVLRILRWVHIPPNIAEDRSSISCAIVNPE